MNPIKRAIIYVRVSTGRQVEGTSLDNQEERCQEWTLKNGVLVLRTFREEGVSAKTTERPQLQEMLKFIRDNHKQIDYLVIYDVDRLARNVEDYVLITAELRKYKIILKDPSSPIETGKSDKLLNFMKAIVAEVDNDNKSERVVDNMHIHANNGFRMAKAPYGLKNARDILDNSIVVADPPISDKIAILLNDFSTDAYTIKELIEKAHSIGLTRQNGKPMNHSYMGKMLTQPLYAGLEKNVHTDNEYVPCSQFKGIIAQDTFWRNQRILEIRNGAKVEKYTKYHPDFPLRVFLSCATCHGTVRGSAPTGNGGRYPQYHCTTCSKAAISSQALNEQFLDLLSKVTPNELSIKLTKTMIIRVWNDELKTTQSEYKKLQKRVNELRDLKQKSIDKFVSDVISKQEKDEIYARANSEISGLNNALEKLSVQIGTQEEAIDYVLSFIDNAPRIWSDAKPEMKALYQSMIFPDGIEYNFYTNQFGTLKMSALYTLVNIKKDPSQSEESLMVTSRRIELRLPG